MSAALETRIARRIPAGESALIQMQRAADAATKAGHRLTHLLRGEPDFDTPAHIVAAAKDALDQGETHYLAAWGLPALREAIASRVAKAQGIGLRAGNVLVTTGASQGLYSAIMAVVDEGDEVVALDPYYGPWEKMVQLAGGRLVTATMAQSGDSLVVDPDALAAAITPRTKVLLINSPMNPTGRVFSSDELAALGSLAVEHDLIVISDETYDAIVYDGHQHVSIASLGPELAERTIIVNSFSKTYAMTGWRIGYNVGPEPLTKATHAVFSQSGRMAASFTQAAGLAAVTGTQEPVETMLREYARRRDLVVRGLTDIGQPIVSPEGTFYVFLDCRRYGLGSMELAEHILEAGRLVVSPGTFFGQGAAGFVRISFAASDEDLASGLAGLRTAFAALEGGGRA